MKRLLNRQLPLLASTALVVAVFVIASWWSFGLIAKGRKAEVRAALRTVLETTRQAFRTWAREERAAARTWAEAPEVVRLTRELVGRPPRKAALLEAPAQARLRSLLGRVQQAKGYEGFFVISTTGINLSSSRDENLGVPNLLSEQPNVLAKLLGGQTALSLPQLSDVPLTDLDGSVRTNRPTMFVGAPIIDSTGLQLAILTFRLNPFLDFTELFQRGRIGDSGETYAFDEQGRLISESRFDEQLSEIGLVREGQRGLLNIEIRDPGVDLVKSRRRPAPGKAHDFTRMAESAIAGEDGYDVDGYRDYRGVRVVGAWLWDEDNRFGITTEIDCEEAFKTLTATRWVSIAMTAIASLLMFGVAALFIMSQRRALSSARQLEEALTKVLSGYLAICANCNKVRDDKGDWQPVELYVGQRTEASFSHGICPDCGVSLYGDLWPAEPATRS